MERSRRAGLTGEMRIERESPPVATCPSPIPTSGSRTASEQAVRIACSLRDCSVVLAFITARLR